jgi:CRISPR/Cas system-associated endonuclease Cas1
MVPASTNMNGVSGLVYHDGAKLASGLDPGLGYLHFDDSYRDSLACDVMEPVRPQVDLICTGGPEDW